MFYYTKNAVFTVFFNFTLISAVISRKFRETIVKNFDSHDRKIEKDVVIYNIRQNKQ